MAAVAGPLCLIFISGGSRQRTLHQVRGGRTTRNGLGYAADVVKSKRDSNCCAATPLRKLLAAARDGGPVWTRHRPVGAGRTGQSAISLAGSVESALTFVRLECGQLWPIHGEEWKQCSPGKA